MLRVNQIKIRAGQDISALKTALLKTLKIKSNELLDFRIIRKSIDARKKPDIYEVYTVDVGVLPPIENKLVKRMKNIVQRVEEQPYVLPGHGSEKMTLQPVIVGSGPAGLFCALLLSQEGYRPILVERGAPVEEREKDVEEFWRTGRLNPASNVQFGEGGAGTFSDGKLNTLVKDSCGRNRYVLETFVKFGAPEQILYEQKPHIGTDILSVIIRRMREEIIRLGGTVRFHTQLTGLCFGDANKLKGVIVNQEERIDTNVCVLAVGHSARDTFQMLYGLGIPMQAKSFAVGVRIEHPQSMIQVGQYGEQMADAMPAAAYKLTEKLENGRGVYTFCMCPGGYVVNASSEENRLAVNGMSYSARAGVNANSAVIVTVTPEDFGGTHPLSGISFQQMLEENAWKAGEGKIPVQCFGDFCRKTITEKFGEVMPQTKGSWKTADVRSIFPPEISDSLEQGILQMDRKIKGFARPDAVLSGVESRTSSPVRILRNEEMECTFGGIYPCGEGAGYAGGITSAAMDGMKAAEAIIKKYRYELRP